MFDGRPMETPSPQEQQQPQPPRVTALIVSRNCVDSLRRCLAALERSQDRELLEILVVDNGSHDGSEGLDSEFENVTVLRLPHHCGLTKARNIGIRTAKGEYLLLLRPEVELDPKAIPALIRRLESDNTMLAAAPLVNDENGAVVTKSYRLPSKDDVARAWEDPARLPAAAQAGSSDGWMELHDGLALLIRKQSIQGMNFLDERYGEYWGDVELAFQVNRAGKKIALATDARATRRSDAQLESPDAALRAIYAADAANGAASYIGKHYGAGSGLLFRLSRALSALFSGQISVFTRVAGGFKIDGTEQGL